MIILREISAIADKLDYEIVTESDAEELTGAEINAAIRALVDAGDFCSVAQTGCKAPAAVRVFQDVSFDCYVVAEHRCHECGKAVCGACSVEQISSGIAAVLGASGQPLPEPIRICRNCREAP